MDLFPFPQMLPVFSLLLGTFLKTPLEAELHFHKLSPVPFFLKKAKTSRITLLSGLHFPSCHFGLLKCFPAPSAV